MSLINQMLKDLEKNNHQKDSSDLNEVNSNSMLPPSPPPKNKMRRLAIILIAVVFIIIVAIIFWPKSKKSSLTTAATENSEKSISIQANQTLPTTKSPATNTMTTPKQASATISKTNKQPVTNNPDSKQATTATDNKQTIGQSLVMPTTKTGAANDNDGNQAITNSQQQDSDVTDTATPTNSKKNQASAINITQPPLSNQQKQAEQYNQAMAYVNQGKNIQAVAILHHILIADPNYKNARLSLAAILMKQKKLDDAKSLLQDGLKQLPKDPDYVKLYAHILAENGQVYLALTQLIDAEPSDFAKHTEYFAFMASLYMQQQSYNKAKILYQRLVTEQPLNSTWWAGLGIAEEQLGMSIQARDAFSHANRIGNLPPSLQAYVQQSLEP